MDDRTNGHRILILAAALKNNHELIDKIKCYICREQHGAVLAEILRLYFYCHLRAEPQDIWLVAALVRATASVQTVPRAGGFLSNFCAAVQCRVIRGWLDGPVLDPIEDAHLLGQRLKRLLEDASPLELEPFAIEGGLRDLSPHLDERDGLELLELYKTLVRDVLVWAERRNGEPIRRMGAYACDVLLDPLARSMAVADASLVDLFERACDHVRKYTNSPTLVDDIRDMGRLIHCGRTWADALATILIRRGDRERTSANFGEATGQPTDEGDSAKQ